MRIWFDHRKCTETITHKHKGGLIIEMHIGDLTVIHKMTTLECLNLIRTLSTALDKRNPPNDRKDWFYPNIRQPRN